MESFGYSLVQVLASMLRLFSLMLVIYALLSWVITTQDIRCSDFYRVWLNRF